MEYESELSSIIEAIDEWCHTYRVYVEGITERPRKTNAFAFTIATADLGGICHTRQFGSTFSQFEQKSITPRRLDIKVSRSLESKRDSTDSTSSVGHQYASGAFPGCTGCIFGFAAGSPRSSRFASTHGTRYHLVRPRTQFRTQKKLACVTGKIAKTRLYLDQLSNAISAREAFPTDLNGGLERLRAQLRTSQNWRS
mmetsp:Transcript_12219/g.18624  ORF Transcript_12219/g.18624 Transcript_12219/m.18624 type:complete len:197 (-) Transcript_12219:169-759(-)